MLNRWVRTWGRAVRTEQWLDHTARNLGLDHLECCFSLDVISCMKASKDSDGLFWIWSTQRLWKLVWPRFQSSLWMQKPLFFYKSLPSVTHVHLSAFEDNVVWHPIWTTNCLHDWPPHKFNLPQDRLSPLIATRFSFINSFVPVSCTTRYLRNSKPKKIPFWHGKLEAVICANATNVTQIFKLAVGERQTLEQNWEKSYFKKLSKIPSKTKELTKFM